MDLIWLEHNGTDIYYGFVGSDFKDSYHASGSRHSKSASGEYHKIEPHHPLSEFKGQMNVCAYCFHKKSVDSINAKPFIDKKSDSVLYLDSRTIPDQVNVLLGFLEPGNYSAILPVHEILKINQIQLITNTVPWIYLMVVDPGSINIKSPDDQIHPTSFDGG